MIRAVADTHTISWYLYNDPRLSANAGSMMDATVKVGDEIAISSITLVEIAYLIEKSRIPLDAFDRVVAELNTPGTNLHEISLNQDIADSLRQVARLEVPEMGDRIIAATALLFAVPVISRDRKIQSSSIATIW